MLYGAKQSWNWVLDNFGTFVDAYFGGSVTPGTNSKGSWSTALLSNTDQNAYWIIVAAGSGGTSGAAVSYLIDIGVDPDNGTSYQVLIPNLMTSAPSISCGGMWWAFPLFIPKGSSIAARAQINSGTTDVRVGVRLLGQPKRPDILQVGSFVREFNVATKTSFGTTSYAAGAFGVEGSYTASVGTTSDRLWYWQAGWSANQSALALGKYTTHTIDVAVGDASNKYLVVDDMSITTTDTEKASNCNPYMSGWFDTPVGSNIYTRGAYSTTAITTLYISAYGVGG